MCAIAAIAAVAAVAGVVAEADALAAVGPAGMLCGPITAVSPHHPRSRHSSRCGRSAPSVVSSPCPGYTTVSSP